MDQPPIDVSNFSPARKLRRMLACLGFYLQHESKVLDFGCGSGTVVYDFRDAGFDAYGFDVTSYVQLRALEDAKYFKFSLIDTLANIPEYSIDKSRYHIPFGDNLFDFLCSTSVLEHVMDYELALGEMARIMKPGGVAIHIFPPRCQWVEPHIGIPLGGYIQNFPWFLFWAVLGVRNEFQNHLGPIGRAKINCHYAKTGLNYMKLSAIHDLCRKHFSEVRFIPEFYEMNDGGSFTDKGRRIVNSDKYRRLYNNTDHIVLFLRKATEGGKTTDHTTR